MTRLLDIWIGQRDFLESKSIEQLIAISGDGTLRDGNETSAQLRELFSNIPSSSISRYVEECLTKAFPNSGLVLQDLVNEIGRRLGLRLRRDTIVGAAIELDLMASGLPGITTPLLSK